MAVRKSCKVANWKHRANGPSRLSPFRSPSGYTNRFHRAPAVWAFRFEQAPHLGCPDPPKEHSQMRRVPQIQSC